MSWRLPLWIAAFVLAGAISWLWPQIDREPSDFDIAMKHLNSGRPDIALLFFNEPRWRGVAAYRAGRYSQATREFANNETVEGLYNQGNSYAQLTDWSTAITTYERVLRFNPDHVDAKFNLALAQRAEELRQGQAVRMDNPPEETKQGEEEEVSSIPQETTPQDTQARESELSDKAGNTSDTDETGESDPDNPAKPEDTVGDTGTAGAVGKSADERDGENNKIVGTVDLKPRNSFGPAEALLRKIEDNPRLVLKARLQAAYETRVGREAK